MLCVGEGGMAPDYFHSRLTFSEAEAFISGMTRRQRSLMHAAYYILNGVRRTLGAKDDCCPDYLKEDPIFDREDSPDAPEPTEDEKAAMAQMVAQADRFFNRKPREE